MEFNNQIATFGKLLKRKESILFFNDVVKQVTESKEEKLRRDVQQKQTVVHDQTSSLRKTISPKSKRRLGDVIYF